MSKDQGQLDRGYPNKMMPLKTSDAVAAADAAVAFAAAAAAAEKSAAEEEGEGEENTAYSEKMDSSG